MFADKQRKVGVIGLGIIGSRVAENLRNADCHVYVWNRSPKTEPNFVSSPAEVAQLAEVVQIFVTNGEALLQVIEAMKESLTKKHLIVNSSTVDVDSTRKAAEIVHATEAQFLDAPFTGSKLAAEKGALVYYVAGDPKAVERAKPVLEISSKEILFFGEVGAATILKVATNMISATVVEVLAESYALAAASGIDPEKLVEAIEHNACGSALTGMKLPAMIARDYEPHFSLKNMFKDAQIALTLAKQLKLELPALTTTASMMYKTIQKGYGEEDYGALARNYQDAGNQAASISPVAGSADSGKVATPRKEPPTRKTESSPALRPEAKGGASESKGATTPAASASEKSKDA